MRVLIVGWSSVLHGESTAGDLLSAEAVARRLRDDGCEVDLAFSPVMLRAYGARGGLLLEDADEVLQVDPDKYTHVVWACGPLTGRPVQRVHERFPNARRLAVGVSVLDPADPAVTGFHAVVPRDAPGTPPRRDLAARPAAGGVPVVGVYLTRGQGEYGPRRRHDAVADRLASWLGGLDAARLELDTRLDPRDWRLPATAEQVLAVLARLDVVVTTRMHGLVLALRAGVPALAVDPVTGGAKVTAQARAWGWPALLTAEDILDPGDLPPDAETPRGDLPRGDLLRGDLPGRDLPHGNMLRGDLPRGDVLRGDVLRDGGVRAGRDLPGGRDALEEQFAWCVSPAGRAAAARLRDEAPATGTDQLDALAAALRP